MIYRDRACNRVGLLHILDDCADSVRRHEILCVLGQRLSEILTMNRAQVRTRFSPCRSLLLQKGLKEYQFLLKAAVLAFEHLQQGRARLKVAGRRGRSNLHQNEDWRSPTPGPSEDAAKVSGYGAHEPESFDELKPLFVAHSVAALEAWLLDNA